MFTIAIVILVCTAVNINCSIYYTSMDNIHKLLHTEQNIVILINRYIGAVQRLKKQFIRYINNTPTEKKVNNSVTAYLLLRHVVTEGEQLNTIIKNLSEHLNELLAALDYESKPNNEDLNGAAFAILRSQRMYDLNTKDLSFGIINFQTVAPSITVEGTLHIASQAYEEAQFDQAVSWLDVSMDLIKRQNSSKTKSLIAKVKADKVKNMFMKSFLKNAVNKETEELKNDIASMFSSASSETAVRLFTSGPQLTQEEQYMKTLFSNYKKLCQFAEMPIPAEVVPLLQCRYNYQHDYQRLFPEKLEVIWPSPVVLLFHDVILNWEINILKTLAKEDEMGVAGSYVSNKNFSVIRDHARIGLVGFLESEKHWIVSRIRRRLERITGLDLRYSENLQVLNYGLAGHYEPHTDFFDSQGNERYVDGDITRSDRIATALIYLSDVESGGATVFPALGVSVPPKKGSVLFWYNLFENGNGDYGTVHAGCPVLLGNKWVANQWISDRGQEFIRPCSTDSKL